MPRTLFAPPLLGLLLALVVPALAQDAGLMLQPTRHVAPSKPATSTLRVSCDMACKWTLDGDAHELIPADSSAVATAKRTQHLLVATSADGLDSVKKMIDVTATGQTVVLIEQRANLPRWRIQRNPLRQG